MAGARLMVAWSLAPKRTVKGCETTVRTSNSATSTPVSSSANRPKSSGEAVRATSSDITKLVPLARIWSASAQATRPCIRPSRAGPVVDPRRTAPRS